MKIYWIVLLVLLGCGQANEEKAERVSSSESGAKSESMEESVKFEDAPSMEKQEEFISSSAAKPHADTSKKFIRTAEMKFRVKNVQKATINIEDLAAKHGGYVTYTNLQTTDNHTSITPISEDSILETMHRKKQIWIAIIAVIILLGLMSVKLLGEVKTKE